MKKILLLVCAALGISVLAVAQRTIKGAVMDSKNEPVMGVQVAVKGTSTGTMTGADGMYTLTLGSSVGSDAIIVFSLLGYNPVEERLGDRAVINVRLMEDEQALEDVVVVAFGQQKKESVVGSVTTISPKSLKVPSSNLTTSFQGKMAGMISYQTSGEPGADNANFFIRGITTFGDGRADPLILIDNIELDATDLARLNPDDIESFSLLKDATATALYGSRGANGVILVKTKSGYKGKAQLSVRVENSFSMPTQELEIADPVTFMKLHNEAILTRDPLRAEIYSQEKIDNTLQPGSNRYIYPATNWHDEMLESYAVTQRASINVSGGGDVATYFVSGSWAIDRGNFKVDEMNNFNNNINLQKIGIRANVDVSLTSTTNLKVMTSASFDDYVGPPLASVNSTNTGGSQMYTLIMHANPVLFPASYPRPDEWSYLNHTLFGSADEGGILYMNPYAELVRGYKEYSRSNMLASIELRQNFDFFTEGLSAKVLFNTNRLAFYSLQRAFNPFYYTLSTWDKYSDSYTLRALNPEYGTEYLNFEYGASTGSLKFNTYMEGSLTYNRDFGDHGVSGMLVGTLRNILNPYRSSSGGVDLQSSLPERNASLSGRFTYAYASRYFGEFNFGYNGSERFSDNHRFGFFPSAGAGWLISNEAFFEPLKNIFTNLKLRYSYGLIGNDQIGNARFLYLSNVNFNGSSLGFGDSYADRYTNNTVAISRYANDQITWETSTKSNYALEFGLYGFDIVAEYYTERREGILQTRTNIPLTMGLWAGVYANLGEAKAKGVDISLDYSKVFNADFWVQARATFTYAHSEYIKYTDYDYQNETWLYHTGYPIRQQWGFIAEGLFVDDADVANSPKQQFGTYMAGDIKYRDVNGDGEITELDKVPVGYPTSPEINYGFGPSFGFYGFDLSFFFSGVARTSFFIKYASMSPFLDVGIVNATGTFTRGNTALAQFIADDHWSESNKNSYATWPRLSAEAVQNNDSYNTWFMRNGAFLRLKQLEFGYTIPEKIVNRAGMTSARIYVSATNLLVFSKFKLWDPELRASSSDYSNGTSYPLQRVVNLGVNISF